MKKLMLDIVLYAAIGIFQVLFLAVMLRTPLFNDTVIYYYRVLYIVLLGAIVSLIVLILFGKKIPFVSINPSLIFSTIFITTSVMVIFATLGSMAMDRSYTIFSIVDMAEKSGQLYTAEEVEDRFIEVYIKEFGSTKRRIDEQVSIGNVENVDGEYRVTSKGERLIKLMRFVESIFPVDEKRILYPNQLKG
ncbi:MAG: hypothetical protein RR413_02755 [Christensenellaceae bacterium]